MDSKLKELIERRNQIDDALRAKTNLFWWGMINYHTCYSWMLCKDRLIESLHEEFNEEAIRDGSELYDEYISEKRIIVRMEGLVLIQEDDYTITVLDESKECEYDEKLFQLFQELYPRSCNGSV